MGVPASTNPKVLILGPRKEDTYPPNQRILYTFRRFECPFNLNNERKVKKLLHNNFGEGYFKVYSPGHAQRMKIYFKGEVKTDRWGRIR